MTPSTAIEYNYNVVWKLLLLVWHAGVGCAGKGFEDRLISFTEQGHGYGLVQFGMVEPFLLQLWAEISHVCEPFAAVLYLIARVARFIIGVV